MQSTGRVSFVQDTLSYLPITSPTVLAPHQTLHDGVAEDAYSMRHLEEQRQAAVDTWTSRVKWLSLLQIAVSLSQFFSQYWYANFASFVVGFVGYHGATRGKNGTTPLRCIASEWPLRNWPARGGMRFTWFHCGPTEWLFVHMVLIVLTVTKNCGVMYLVFDHRQFDAFSSSIVAVCLADTLLLEPAAMYCSFWLYQSMAASLSFRR